MGKAATAFKDIGKACSDLLSKDYTVGKTTVEVKSKTSNGVTFTPKTVKAGDSFSGSVAAKYGFMKGVDGEVTMATSGSVAANLELSDQLTKGLKIILDCETPSSGKPGLLAVGKAAAEYKSELFTSKTTYDYIKKDLGTALSGAYQAFTVGCSADYSLSKAALTKLGAACQYVAPEFILCAKYTDSVGKADGKTYAGTYYHSVSSDMQVGAELVKAMSKPDVAIALGCSYKLDKDTTVKAKVDSAGLLLASYKQKISPLTTMCLASQIDTVNLSDNKHKFGLTLNITP